MLILTCNFTYAFIIFFLLSLLFDVNQAIDTVLIGILLSHVTLL